MIWPRLRRTQCARCAIKAQGSFPGLSKNNAPQSVTALKPSTAPLSDGDAIDDARACVRAPFRTAPPRSLRTRALSVLASTTEPAPAPVEIEPLPVLYETPDSPSSRSRRACRATTPTSWARTRAADGRPSRRRAVAARRGAADARAAARARWLGKRVNLVHRIDQPTSGCLLISFHADASRALQAALSSARARKTYFALCRGEGTPLRERGTFVVDGAVRDEKGRRARRRDRFTRGALGLERAALLPRARAPAHGAVPPDPAPPQARELPDPRRLHRTATRATRRVARARGLHRLALHLHRLELRGDDADGSAALLAPGGLDVTCPLPDDFRGWIGGTSWGRGRARGRAGALRAAARRARARGAAAARELHRMPTGPEPRMPPAPIALHLMPLPMPRPRLCRPRPRSRSALGLALVFVRRFLSLRAVSSVCSPPSISRSAGACAGGRPLPGRGR